LAILAAVIATPIVIAASFTLLSFWQLLTTGGWSPWLALSAWAVLSAVATPATLAIVVLAAAPWARRLHRQGGATLPGLIGLGIVLAVLPFALFDGYVVVRTVVSNPLEASGVLLDDLPVALKWAALAALCGAGSATAYWAVARRR